MSEGRPVAPIIGVEKLDEEQLQFGSSDRFWTLMRERRGEKSIARAELEEQIRAEESR